MTQYLVAGAALLVVLVAGLWWALSRHDAGLHRRPDRQDRRYLDALRRRWAPWMATGPHVVPTPPLPIQPTEVPEVRATFTVEEDGVVSTVTLTDDDLSTIMRSGKRDAPEWLMLTDPLTGELPPGTRFARLGLVGVGTREMPGLSEELTKYDAWRNAQTSTFPAVDAHAPTEVDPQPQDLVNTAGGAE
jgi:hypothetical protein